MKTIRRQVFETNSSSMHSISISKGDTLEFPKYITMRFGEFGWEEETYYDETTKLSYVLTSIQYHMELPEYPERPAEMSWETWKAHPTKLAYAPSVEKAILESKYFLWITEMLADVGVFVINELDYISDYWRFGYIDHQSTDVIDDIWSDDEATFKENMKNFIFNSNCSLTIDNDNH